MLFLFKQDVNNNSVGMLSLAFGIETEEGSVLGIQLKVTRKERKNFILKTSFAAALTICSHPAPPALLTNNV